MATYRAVVKVPGTSFGVGFEATSLLGVSFPASLEEALNGYAPYAAPTGGWSFSHRWSGASSPPSVPWTIGAMLWDVGTNSPDGVLPATIVISDVDISSALLGTSPVSLNVFWFTSASALGPFFTSSNGHFATNPVTGAAWTRADLFSQYFGFRATSGDYTGMEPNNQFIPFATGTSPDRHSDDFEFLQAVVTYTLSAPTEVDVTGAGGVTVGGPSTITQGPTVTGVEGVSVGGTAVSFGIGAGAPPELSLNQWGIEGFTLYPAAQERL